MKFSKLHGHTLIGLLLPLALAQQMPLCAERCLQSALGAQNLCSPTDTACICSTQSLLKSVEGCVLGSCTVIEALVAQNSTQTLCHAPVRDITHITPIVTATSGGVALLSVIIRLISTETHPALDDIFAVAAMVSALPMGILEFVMAADGFGKDIWNIPAEKIYRIVKFTWLTEIFYFMAIAFTKLSFLFFCLRIFPRKELRLVVHALVGITVAYGLSFIIACIFNCTPVSYIWTSWDGEHTGTCINFHVFAWVHAAINIALDVMIIGVPIPELLRLSLSTKKKVYIIMMFSLGAFTTIVSIIRLQALVQFAASTNPTYDNVTTAYWSVLEAFVGILCICLPALRRFLGKLFPRCFGSTQSNSKYEPYDTPNKLSAGRPTNPRATASVGRDWGITKTIDTTVVSKGDMDDEIQLVDFRNASNGSGSEGRR